MINYTGELLISIKEEKGLTLKELADELGLTLGQVKSRIYRAQERAKNGESEPSPSDFPAKSQKKDEVKGNQRTLTASGVNRGGEETESDLQDGDFQDDAFEEFFPDFVRSMKVEKKVGPDALMVTSLDDLYEMFNVNIEEWVILESVLNFWGNYNVPNSQAKVRITPKNPEPVLPMINPVQINVSIPEIPEPKDRQGLRIFLLPDPHIGFERDIQTAELFNFHDRRALDIAVQIVRETQPDIIALLGDILDLAEWSTKFFRTPEAALVTQPALFETAWWFTQLRLAAPNAEIVYLEGNHEQRIPKLIAAYAPQAFDLRGVKNVKWPILSIPNLLDLESLDITWVPGYPKNEYWVADNFRLVHGETVRGKSGRTSKVVVEERHYGEAFGHIHRAEIATKTVDDRHGKQYLTVFSPGCLCHIDGRVPGGKSHYNWQNAIGEVEIIDGVIQPSITYIHDNKAIHNGKMYTGSPRIQQIMRETGLRNLVDTVIWTR